jgi:hypothetical protein
MQHHGYAVTIGDQVFLQSAHDGKLALDPTHAEPALVEAARRAHELETE